MKYISRIFTVLIALFGIVIFFGCGEKPPETFSISGYVLEDGVGVSDVTLSSDVGNVTTDENGFFIFSDISNGLTIEAQKEGYTFEKISQTFFGATTNATFIAHKYYDITGKVVSNGIGIEGVKVTASALKGGYTVTNNSGEFVLYNIAGNATLSAEKAGFVFFEKTCSHETSQNIQITATTNCNINIDYCGLAGDFASDTKVFVNNSEVNVTGNSFVLENLTFGTKISLSNDFVKFEPNQVIISKENQIINFVGEKIYSISGFVKSGSTALGNALLSIGEITTFSNSQGYFTFDNVTGENTVCCSVDGFEFNNIVCNEANNSIEFQGTTSLFGRITNNGSGFAGVNVISKKMTSISNADGSFELHNLQLGDVVNFECSTAKLSVDATTVLEANKFIEVTAQNYYNATICVVDDYGESLNNVNITLNNNIFVTNQDGIVELTNLFGTNYCNIELDGYKALQNVEIGENQNVYNIVLQKLYNASITLKTGDIVLSNKQVVINEETYSTNENGEILFNNLFGELIFNISCEGYNNISINTNSKDYNKNVSLTYNISGYVKSGNVFVPDVKVSYDDNFVLSDKNGYFTITNLEGQIEITYYKEFYNFQTSSIVSSQDNNIIVETSYKVFGYAMSDDLGLFNTQIIITSSNDENNLSVYTNQDGYYEFNNIYGENVLFYVNADGLKLRPLSYSVLAGGQYDFMLNGYELGGYVLSNGEPVEDVKISAGESVTYTNEDGFYYFNLLKTDCEIMAYKEGYSFTPNTISVTTDDNERKDVNFEASYIFEGYILWGDKPVDDVAVSVGDNSTTTNELGYFKFDSIVGTNEICFSKNGYEIKYSNDIKGYVNLKIQAGAIITGVILSGDLLVGDVDVKLGIVTTKTNESGLFVATVYQNNFEIECVKEGFSFDTSNFAIKAGEKQSISASYSISGIVKSSDILINDVTIKINDEETNYKSEVNGTFNIINLTGTTTLSFEKDGYQIDRITVNEPGEIVANATFSVYGYITFNNSGLKDITVSSNGNSVLTNEDGYYIISGLVGSGNLTIEKNGYNFVGEKTYAGYCQLDFNALFTISGVIKSGETVLTNVNVKYGDNETLTNENGYFYMENIAYAGEIEFSKTGYNTLTKTYFEYCENDIINLSYNATIIFNGLDNYENIIISVTNEQDEESIYNSSNSRYTIENISGEIYVSLSKTGYVFNPQVFAIKSPTAISVNVNKSYSVSGKVLIDGTNVPIIGMKVSAGNEVAYTDSNGYYVLNNLVGKTVIKGELSYDNCITISTSSIQVSGEIVQDFTVSALDYTFFMFQKGYQLLEEANSSYVSMNGTVSLTMGGTQQVRGIRKRDSNGITLTEKMNYGNSVAGIDPKVSLLTYYNRNTGETKYQQVKNVSSDYVATYGSFTNTSASEYKSLYGLYPYDHYAYIINKSTITSVNNIVKDGTNTTFTFNLNTGTAVSNYIKQMSSLSGQTPSKFNYCNLTYTIGDDGYIRTLKIKEEYVINVVVSVTGTSEITETYMITDKDTKLTDINLNDIHKSLEFEVKTNENNVLSMPNKKFSLKGEEK